MSSLLRLNRHLVPRLSKPRYSSAALKEDEYTATPQYPPILDISPEKVREREKENDFEALKNVKTVEEKQIKLNMPKYYGFKCYMFHEDYIPYNNLKLVQHVTRTHLIQNDKLPDFYNTNLDVDLGNLKSQIEEALLLELDGYQRIYDIKKEELEEVERENLISFSISKQINRILLNNLTQNYPHLNSVQIDYNSRIESFWWSGGMNPPENIRRYRRGTEWQKNVIDEPTDRAMNYIGSSNIALRSEKPLLPIISPSDAENPDLEVPHFELDPRTVGTKTEQNRHIANIPGFWPGDPKEFGLLSYHKRGHFLTRHYNDPEDDKEALNRQGILASFAWLNAQANFQGFNSYNDITYPLVTQSVITNGQTWSFYVYQLNTILMHSKHPKENPKRNICWATPEMKLYEQIQDGKLVGFNDEVLKNLVFFYANKPESRLGVNLKPYLSQETKLCAEYEDDDKREWLEREYKYLVSNRRRFKLPYEIYAWEKIYKIDNNTRFMDKKTRPFELGIKPFNRKLDDRKPRYIPRAHRPELPRYKGRDAKEYFP